MKKLLLISLFLNICFAVTCPSVSELKNNQLHNWVAFDADNGTELSTDRLKKYEEKLQYFCHAEFLKGAPEGEAECYYRNDTDPYYLDVYLAQPGLKPDLTSAAWHERPTLNKCHGSVEACGFVEK